MLSFNDGRPIARITSGKYKGKIIYVDEEEKAEGPHYQAVDLRSNLLDPVLDPEHRTINFIAGPSGSGKSTYAGKLAETFHKLFPKKHIFFFGRKSIDEDPAFKSIVKSIKQVPIDENLVRNPVVLEDIDKGSLCIFDDVGTIYDEAQKTVVFKLMEDLMEVGRARKIDLIITSHLVSPNDRKFARTVLNELHILTVFGKSGSRYQIEYVLQKYFGMAKKQIDKALNLPSRWLSVIKSYPMTVMYAHGAYVV